MQCIFRKENIGKARKYRLYRHLTTFEKIIKILMSFCMKIRSKGNNKRKIKHLILQDITHIVFIIS